MDSALGTRDMRELQRLMQLTTDLFKKAKDAGVNLPEPDEKEFLELVGKVHGMMYGNQTSIHGGGSRG